MIAKKGNTFPKKPKTFKLSNEHIEHILRMKKLKNISESKFIGWLIEKDKRRNSTLIDEYIEKQRIDSDLLYRKERELIDVTSRLKHEIDDLKTSKEIRKGKIREFRIKAREGEEL